MTFPVQTIANKKYQFNNNTYLLYEGTLERYSKIEIKIGMWIDYETITNEYKRTIVPSIGADALAPAVIC